MVFATGFILLAETHIEEPLRSQVLSKLEQMGFELYEVGRKHVVVFYVEAPDVKRLEEVIKAAEAIEGVAKAYIVYGFMGDEEKRREINEAIWRGDVVLDETTIRYIDWILSKLQGKAEDVRP